MSGEELLENQTIEARSPRILYVDDDDVSRKTACRVLKEAGFIVVEAARGNQALQLAAHQPDLIILNDLLPDINGFNISQLLKANRTTATIPTLHLSDQHINSQEQIWRLDCNADGDLAQPMKSQELLAHIRALLRIGRAEAALRRSEATARQQLAEIETIYATAPIGLCFIDTNLRFIRINERLAEINGIPASEHVGRTLRECLPEMADSLEPLYRQVIESSQAILNLEVSGTNIAQPGVKRDWLINLYPLSQEDGQVLGVNVTVEEITERKSAETALKDSERRIASLAKLSPVGIFRSDRDGNVTYVNDRFCEITGLSPEASLGLDTARSLHPDDRERVLSEWLQAVDNQLPFRSEYRHQHADGTIRWTIGQTIAETDENGQIIGYIGTLTDISDRKRAEQQLLESEQLLRLGTQVAGFALAKFDYASNTVKLSPEAAALYGLPTSELVVSRARIHATFHPEERAELAQLIEQVLDPTGPGWFARDHRVVWPNGEVRWLSVRKQVFFNHNDREFPRPVYAILAAIDITGRKQTEEALRASEEKYRTLIETMDQGFCICQMLVDSDGKPTDYRFLEVNPLFEKMTGLEQATGKTALELVPNLEAFWIETYGRVALTGEPIRFENQSNAMDGRWFDVNALHIGDPQSHKFAIFFTNISDRKLAEQHLRESEERFQIFMDNSPLAAFIKDEAGYLTYTNRCVEKLFNQSGRELVGCNDFEILPYEIAREIQEHDRTIFATGEASEFIETIPNEAGNLTHWLTIKFPLVGRNQQPLLGGIAVDITSRLQAEQQLKQQAQELIQLNAALKQTTSQLTERNEELNQFAYIISHDLKAPLRAIANLSQWLSEDLEGKLDEDNKRNIELLQNRVYCMGAMIDGLLAYSKTGRTEVETTTFNVGELLVEVLDSLAPPPTFSIKVQSSMPTIKAKRLLLSQVFSNLISNAIKHHPRPNGQIEILGTQREQYYEFTVADDGNGIASENHDRIFHIFEMLNGPGTKESSGIGLSIVKKVIETEGGEISLESELGSGATFRFTWPIEP